MRLTLQARLIPPGTTVMKPTGTKEYVLKKDIPIYGEGAKIVTTKENLMFMVADGSINVITGTDEVAVDFKTLEEMKDFVDLVVFHNTSHQ